MMNFEGSLICTKRENDRRFWNANCIIWLRRAELSMLEYDYLGAGCYKFETPTFYFQIGFLGEDKTITLVRALIGKRDYKPQLDIDRYFVECGAFHVVGGVCPVFEELRHALEVHAASVGPEIDRDNRRGSALACYGDGRVGPIASVLENDFEFVPSDDALCAICKNCKYRCDKSGNRASDRAKLLEYRPASLADTRIVCYVKNVLHKRIIPFFKRLIRR